MNISPEMKAWNNCLPEDLWVFDKLIVAKKQGIFVVLVVCQYQNLVNILLSQ
jgi:hypothetical protein